MSANETIELQELEELIKRRKEFLKEVMISNERSMSIDRTKKRFELFGEFAGLEWVLERIRKSRLN